jgi:hypothetical protein
MSNPLRPHFERDLEDSLLILKEVLVVSWRFNPSGIAAYLCGQLFEGINDATPTDQKAAMVAETLGSIEIVPVETFENDFSSNVGDVCKGLSGEFIGGAIKVYPQIEEFLRAAVGDEDAAITQSFTRLTLSAVTKHRSHYQQLEGYYKQLMEGLPRYTSVMTRTGFLDGIIGFAAGFFGGYLGAAGAQAWDNWRGSSDQEFCQKFGAAFEEFAQACHNYTTNGENSLSLVFDRLMDETRRIHHRIFDCYEELAQIGWDIEPLYRQYRTLDEPLDDDAKQAFEIAISNLEENRSVHYRSIENIRQILGMSTSPAPAVVSAPSPPPPPSHHSPQRSVPPPLPHG